MKLYYVTCDKETDEEILNALQNGSDNFYEEKECATEACDEDEFLYEMNVSIVKRFSKKVTLVEIKK